MDNNEFGNVGLFTRLAREIRRGRRNGYILDPHFVGFRNDRQLQNMRWD